MLQRLFRIEPVILVQRDCPTDEIFGSAADFLPDRIILQDVKIAFAAQHFDCSSLVFGIVVMEQRFTA